MTEIHQSKARAQSQSHDSERSISAQSDSIIIGRIELSRDVLQVDIGRYQGRCVFSARKWFRAESGELRPTAKGLTLTIAHLPKVVELLLAALARAEVEGLLPPNGGKHSRD
jgi:hypothetical protein